MISQSHLLAALRRDCHIPLIDSLDFASGSEEKKEKNTPIDRRTDVGVTRQLVHWLTRQPFLQQSQSPPSVVSGRCPSNRLSDGASRSASRAAGRGEVGRRRTGSGARSVWTTRCLGSPGLSVWKHCKKVKGVTAREWIASPVTWLEGSSVSCCLHNWWIYTDFLKTWIHIS